MLKKYTETLVKAREKQDDAEIKASLKKIERIVKSMNNQERAKFDTQLNTLNIQLDKFDEGASILSDGLSKFDHTNQEEVDKLMQQVMQEEANKLYRSMPDVPTHDPRGPLPTQRTTSQETLNRLNSQEVKVPTGPLKNASTAPKNQHQTHKNPIKVRSNQPIQPQQHQAKQPWENAAPKTTAQTKPQIETKPSTPVKKPLPSDDAMNKFRQNLTERRKASMVDAKNDLKNAYKAIKNLLKKIVEAISKAPEQEKKLNAQDKHVIEQSAKQLTKQDVTPDQAIAHTKTILNQLEHPSQPGATSNTNQEDVTSKQGWLSRSLDVVKSTLTHISHTLGFKSAKNELQETIKNLEPTADSSKAKDNEQELEPPRSGL